EIVPGYPFELVSGEKSVQRIGTINSYQSEDNMKIIKYTLRVNKDTIAGSYDLNIKYFEKESSVSVTKSISLDVNNKESAEIIYIDQVELIPGKIIPLTFTINNVGSAPLRELSFQWENEDDIILPVGSDNTKYIKYIDVGDSVDLKFDVIASANADPDLYKLDLVLTYEDDSGSETQISTKAGVYVGGPTDFDIAFSGTSNGESTFSIANIGSVSATSVTVKIPDQTGWKVTGSNSVIIGNLNEGDYTIASFTIQKNSQMTKPADTDVSVQKTIPIDNSNILIEVVYTDSRGNRETVTKKVLVDSSSMQSTTMTLPDGTTTIRGPGMRTVSQQSFWDKYGNYIIIVVIVLVLFVGRKNYKKRKFNDSNYTYKQFFKDCFKKKSKK
ncbi:MAG: COG1361 S-layer family protein, partial [Nanoarchaeota archaeon]|nr:COG1361 S-layer family protein [Nanoarchaeota archaeon]